MSESALVVADASVVVKWFLPEPLRPEGLKLLFAHREGNLVVAAPDFVRLEIGSVLTKRVRRQELTASQARQALAYLDEYSPVLFDTRPLLASAVELSLQRQQALYDCLYLALALERRCEFVTADQRFHASMRPMYPCVNLLGPFAASL